MQRTGRQLVVGSRPVVGGASPRRGLSRDEAAGYIGISASKFDSLVADGRMPPAKQIDGRKVWDIYALDAAFEALPNNANIKQSSWDDL
jgi:predicted DNA-binding transcriptional regulator AlpA